MFASDARRGSRPWPVEFPLRSRRLVEGLAFVAVWIGLGYAFPVSAETYLLMGIPLTIAFQFFVRRRPLRELWVRDPESPSLGRRDALVIMLVAVAPAYWGVRAAEGGRPVILAWYAAATLGAVAAAYALRATSVREMLRAAAVPTLIGVIGNVLVVGTVQVIGGAEFNLLALTGSTAKWLLIYFPATFVIEEVAFRGALDAHVHLPGERRGRETAIFVSALWGLWHLPVASGFPFPILVLTLVVWHVAIGIPLSRAWRRTGNLAGPAAAHSAIDAVRNALLGL